MCIYLKYYIIIFFFCIWLSVLEILPEKYFRYINRHIFFSIGAILFAVQQDNLLLLFARVKKRLEKFKYLLLFFFLLYSLYCGNCSNKFLFYHVNV